MVTLRDSGMEKVFDGVTTDRRSDSRNDSGSLIGILQTALT